MCASRYHPYFSAWRRRHSERCNGRTRQGLLTFVGQGSSPDGVRPHGSRATSRRFRYRGSQLLPGSLKLAFRYWLPIVADASTSRRITLRRVYVDKCGGVKRRLRLCGWSETLSGLTGVWFCPYEGHHDEQEGTTMSDGSHGRDRREVDRSGGGGTDEPIVYTGTTP
jgi:hypothetical protein